MVSCLFTPRLGLRPGKGGAALLSASTLVPSGHYSALEAAVGTPDGITVVPEVFAVTLPLNYTAGPATQAFKNLAMDRSSLPASTSRTSTSSPS